MVFYVFSDKLEEIKLKLNEKINESVASSSCIDRRSKELKELFETRERQQKEIEDTRRKIEKVVKEIEILKIVLNETDREKENLKNLIESAMLLPPITVDDERNEEIWNGLISLNRDVLMKLIEIVRDGKKIRNIIGISLRTYDWSKKQIFRWAVKNILVELPLSFIPNPAICTDIIVTGTTFVGITTNLHCIFLDRKMQGGLFKAIFKTETVGYGFVGGLADESRIPHFHNSFNGISNSCQMYRRGILCGTSKVCDKTFFEAGQNTIALELDVRGVGPCTCTGLLSFFVNGKQIPHVVTRIPPEMLFFFGMSKIDGKGNDVKKVLSFQQLAMPTTDPKLQCAEYEWC